MIQVTTIKTETPGGSTSRVIKIEISDDHPSDVSVAAHPLMESVASHQREMGRADLEDEINEFGFRLARDDEGTLIGIVPITEEGN